MSDPKLLERIDRHIQDLFVPGEPAFAQALADAQAAGLPDIHVSPNEGKLLYLLAKLSGARRILEIGLLGGYSAMWLAKALPAGGTLLSLEINAAYAQVAQANLTRAGLDGKFEVRVGPALESLAKLVDEKAAPFDLVFIDADKEPYPHYLDFALKLTRSGSLILGDNVIRGGRVIEASGEPAIEAVRTFNRKLAEDPRLEALLLPIMRERIDGLAIARVR